MKQLKQEIRMLICTKLLSWCISIAPHNREGFELIDVIQSYLSKTLKQIEHG